MATRAEQRSELLDIAGLDLEPEEANRLLGESDSELCVRSGFTRANVPIGGTVVDQAAYDLPSNVYRPLKVYVDGRPFAPSDEDTVRRIETGELRLKANGLFWLDFDGAGVEGLSIYPTPGTADLQIVAKSVVYPPDWTDDNSQGTTPQPFQRGRIHYCAAIGLGGPEDDADLQSFHEDKFEGYVTRLRAHRLSRTGAGPIQLRVAGVN